jgi:hypothetical protein
VLTQALTATVQGQLLPHLNTRHVLQTIKENKPTTTAQTHGACLVKNWGADGGGPQKAADLQHNTIVPCAEHTSTKKLKEIRLDNQRSQKSQQWPGIFMSQ